MSSRERGDGDVDFGGTTPTPTPPLLHAAHVETLHLNISKSNAPRLNSECLCLYGTPQAGTFFLIVNHVPIYKSKLYIDIRNTQCRVVSG